MKRGGRRLAVLLAAVFTTAAVAAGSRLTAQTFPKPSVTEGLVDVRVRAMPVEPMTVRGEVTVSSLPTVSARQFGSWAVELAGRPVVRSAGPAFLENDGTYEFRWAPDHAETYRLLELGADGWVLGERADAGEVRARRWLNASLARSIELVGR